MNGKGDKRRPSQVSDKELTERWAKAFSKPQANTDKSKEKANGKTN